jgi:hypothetical protein
VGNDLEVINAWAGIVAQQNTEIEALHMALSLERNESWLNLNPLAYHRVLKKFGNNPPHYLTRAYDSWRLRKNVTE